MKSSSFISLFFTLLFFQAYGPQQSEFGFQKELEPLIAKTMAVQSFGVGKEDTVLIGKKGTIIHIPANCFETDVAQVELKLIEAPTKKDLVLLNVQTVAQGKLLTSDGVVFLQAYADGEVIQPKKSIQIKIPNDQLNTEMTAFTGQFDEKGTIDWTLNNKMDFDTAAAAAFNEMMTTGLVEIPFSLFPYQEEYARMDSLARLYPIKNGKVKAPVIEYLVSPSRAKFYRDIIQIIQSEKYKGTYLATREFAERLYRLQYVDHTYHYPIPDSRGWFSLAHDYFAKRQHRVVNIYIENIGQDLYYADSLAYLEVRKYKPLNTGNFDFESYKVRCEEQIAYFHKFYQEKLTTIIQINDHGVDLSSGDALAQLIRKGVQPEEAYKLIRLYTNQQEVIAGLKDDQQAFIASLEAKKELLQQKRQENQLRYYLITANQLGWINVDQFYNNPNAKEVKLLASLKQAEELDFVNVSLVLKNQKSFLSGYLTSDGNYRFTKDDSYYNKLPVGEPATLVAISYKNEQVYLGMKEMVIGDEEFIDLDIEQVAISIFEMQLAELNND